MIEPKVRRVAFFTSSCAKASWMSGGQFCCGPVSTTCCALSTPCHDSAQIPIESSAAPCPRPRCPTHPRSAPEEGTTRRPPLPRRRTPNGCGSSSSPAAGDEILRALRLDASRGIEESSVRSMLDEPSSEMRDHDGLCARGKQTYLFSRCPSCSWSGARHCG